MITTTFKQILIASVICILAACSNGNSTKKENNGKDTSKTSTTTPTSKKEETPVETVKPGIVNIIDTVVPKQTVICVKDSALTIERVGMKLGKIYGGTLAEVLKKNNMKQAGAPMAWYTGAKAPYFFEAGVPVSKVPAKLGKGVFVKEISADSAVVAHFYGPYNLLSQGYDALREWMKDAKKKPVAAPFEIYIGDPIDPAGNPIDPYKVRTDIVFPRK